MARPGAYGETTPKLRCLPMLCALLGVALLWIHPAAALAAPRLVQEPPLLQPRLSAESAASASRSQPSPARDSAREQLLELNIVYTEGDLYNPATNSNDKVRLRSYQGDHSDPAIPFISPQVVATPGQTLRFTLHNQLPKEDPSCTTSVDVNKPHCFNTTNLHSHGLWISPAGNSDNVLLSIHPGQSFQYEYNIPADHPAGTFWYHTHRHGSTALQVSSGMAGALVIKGKRLPTPDHPGDLDTLLQPSTAQPFHERLVVLQQIPYACRNADGTIKADSAGHYLCDANDTAGVEGYDQLGSGAWLKSGRYTSINGQVLPTFDGAHAGQIERWRLIHGGVRDSINLQFRQLRSDAPDAEGLKADDNDAFVAANCTGDPLPQHLVAADGLTLNQAINSTQTVLQPGYRWDALMVFPEQGNYCVIDTDMPASGTVNQAAPSRQLLGFVQVGSGKSVPADLGAYLSQQLVTAAELTMPANVRSKVITDLKNGIGLQSFAPHPDIQDSELTGKQDLTFNIDVTKATVDFEVDGKPYDPARLDRILKLDGVDEWTMKSDFVSHPFHIHVNPFQIMAIYDASGRDVSTADAIDGSGDLIDPQYRALKGVWKDTLWIKNPSVNAKDSYTVVLRSRYERYIGDFVLHCHILDHEDQGMMQNVRISLADAGA